MPASSLPACSSCLKNTMDIFAAAASNTTQPVSVDYVDAAQMFNQNCGPNFVNGTIPNLGASGTGKTSGASSPVSASKWMSMSLGLVIALHLHVTL